MICVCFYMSNKIPTPATPWYREADDFAVNYANPQRSLCMTRELLVAVWALKNPCFHWSNYPVDTIIKSMGNVIINHMKTPGAAYKQLDCQYVDALAYNNREVLNDAVSLGRKILDHKSAGQNAWVQSLIASGSLSKPNRAR